MKEVFKVQNDCLTRTDYDCLLELVRQNGMDYKWAEMFVKKLKDDENEYSVDDDTKKWALERGFYPGRVPMYGLTEENYKNYIPDYSYFMIHPMNHHFRKWLDKLTLKYVLNSGGCESSMPKYYLYVENNGNYTYLMDLDDRVKRDNNFIFNLLKEKKCLAIKPNSGTSGGKGFMKVEWDDNTKEICINNKKITKEYFFEICNNLGNNIVTEYCKQHENLAKVWPNSECTLRLIMAKMPYKNIWDNPIWHNVISLARFGTSVSGGTSNMSAGGVGVGFDYKTGKCKPFGLRYRRFCEDGNIFCYEHPDTLVPWEGLVLPNWQAVKKQVEKVCEHISSLDYLGLDVIITQEGMCICEINSHPGIDEDQITCNPIFEDPKVVEFFDYHGIFEVDNSEFYKMYKESQILR